jgi:hypothetical protein
VSITLVEECLRRARAGEAASATSAGLGNRARGVRSRAQRVQARVLEEHVLQNVAANLVHDPRRSAGVEEGHGVEIGGSEGDADMAYAVGVAARAEGQAVLSAKEGGRASQCDKV